MLLSVLLFASELTSVIISVALGLRRWDEGHFLLLDLLGIALYKVEGSSHSSVRLLLE